MEIGFHYFQGYFFQKPVILQTREISPLQIHALPLLREVSKSVVDLNEVEKQIKADASVVYRLLRYLNSSALFFTAEIRSVRHALMVLGEKQIRKRVALVVTLHAERPDRQNSSALLGRGHAFARTWLRRLQGAARISSFSASCLCLT
jgi:EAL and modified HD-GYP domain-containing signal transduction protein